MITWNQMLKILLFSAVFLFFLRPIDGSGDFFHHLNTGKYVLETKSLPQIDQYTFTAEGNPWVGYAWGGGLIFYLTFKYFSEAGVSFLVATLGVTTIFLLYIYLRSLNVNRRVCFLTVSLTAPLLSIRWLDRPELFTYPFLLIILLLDSFKKTHPKLPLLYPLIIILWANLYGSSVILGLLVLTFILFKQLFLDKFKPSLKLFYLPVLLSFPISLFNGYGFKTIFYILNIPQVTLYEGEWAGIIFLLKNTPVNFLLTFQYLALTYFLFLAFFLANLLINLKNLKNHPALLILSAAVFMPFIAFRQAPLAVLLSIPLLSVLLSTHKGLKFVILEYLGYFLAVAALLLSIWVKPIGISSENISSKVRATQFIAGHNLTGKIFNHQINGSFLTYYLYPKNLVYIDTRDDLFLNTEAFEILYQTFNGNLSITPILEKYSVDLVLANPANDNLNYSGLFLSDDWAPVYFDDGYLIVIRKKIAEEKKIKLLDAINLYNPSLSKEGQIQKAFEQYQNSFKNDYYLNRLILARLYYLNGDFENALKLIDQIKAQNGPANPVIELEKLSLKAQIYNLSRDCERLKKTLEQIELERSSKLLFNPHKKLPLTLAPDQLSVNCD